eukprot:scaffold1667_cov258-Pinguiococcus_pyrenoidosus.AAC.10
MACGRVLIFSAETGQSFSALLRAAHLAAATFQACRACAAPCWLLRPLIRPQKIGKKLWEWGPPISAASGIWHPRSKCTGRRRATEYRISVAHGPLDECGPQLRDCGRTASYLRETRPHTAATAYLCGILIDCATPDQDRVVATAARGPRAPVLLRQWRGGRLGLVVRLCHILEATNGGPRRAIPVVEMIPTRGPLASKDVQFGLCYERIEESGLRKARVAERRP